MSADETDEIDRLRRIAGLLAGAEPYPDRSAVPARCVLCRAVEPEAHMADCPWRLAREHRGLTASWPHCAPACALPEPEALLRVLCKCGHTAEVHGRSDGRCMARRPSQEGWCPCERFVSTGVLAGDQGDA